MLTNERTKQFLQLAVSKRPGVYTSIVDKKMFLQVAHRFVGG